MDFEIPSEINDLLKRLDAFIEDEIKPLERENDNIRFFDHRREYARTDFENDGIPRPEWYALLGEMRRRADAAGFLRWALPEELGGSGGSNLGMAIIREHLAAKGLGLHNDLQNESSIVGNFPTVLMMHNYGTPEQKAEFVEGMITGQKRVAFGLTEPNHGSDATWLETTAVRDGDEWVINGAKRFNTGLDHATHDMIFARTSGDPGDATGITCFLVPTDTPGFDVQFMWWTFNMPSEHAELRLDNVRVPHSSILGQEGRGLDLAQLFVHENRIRQAASGVGAAQYCVDESVAYAKVRHTFGKPLWKNQAIQFPLAEMQTRIEMVRWLVRFCAWSLDRNEHMAVSDKVAMANYSGNQLVCDAADLAIQVHGGIGYTRHKQFEHIYRHHRRYRITEGSDQIQIRRIGQRLFSAESSRTGFIHPGGR
jgi:alkylation response protein AidB-like acyl-CoA dehydrogenase